MAGQEQRATAAGPSSAREDARSRGVGTDESHVEAAFVEPCADDLGELAFAGAAQHERRVRGVDRDESARERDHVGARHPLA